MRPSVALFSGFLFLLLELLIRVTPAHAYPEFIGYGYTSCITCHYNTQGNGPLNDYGRALFAGEISARDVFDESTTDDQLGASAGFLGKKELPWWLRPSFKFRGLWLNTAPGLAPEGSKWSYNLMQEDVNLTFLVDKEQKYVVQLNIGRYAPANGFAPAASTPEIWFSREHYVRIQAMKSLWVSVGMLETVYGLRIVDHTAYSRGGIGVENYEVVHGALTHGAVVQYNQSEYEITGHLFIGNLNENTDAEQKVQQKGLSLMYERNVGEKSRAGVSVLSSSSDTVKQMRLGVHDKLGLSIGSALLSEVGYYSDKQDTPNAETSGFYGLLESTVLLRRGYNLLGIAEYLNKGIKTDSGNTDKGDSFRYGFGFLTFPLPRTELRFTARDQRQWLNTNGTKDNWDLQAQLHISL